MTKVRGKISILRDLLKRMARDKIAVCCLLVVIAYTLTALTVDIYAWNCRRTQTVPIYSGLRSLNSQ